MLNAFRHQRKKRASGLRGAGRSCCAQRLPASKEETPRISRGVATPFTMCSTPSGIKGRNAPSQATPIGHTRLVLNAFRHQRKKRLRFGERDQVVDGCVLNAFRHQRKKRDRWNTYCLCIVLVLNAFRHQRKKRSRDTVGEATDSQVLNAFRHQRKKRHSTSALKTPQETCSTPSGIKGRNASNTSDTRICRSCAQRLPASKEETRIRRVEKDSGEAVLNAFRHQRKKRRALDEDVRQARQVLNAFRHQRKKRRLVLGRPERHGDVLNAFRHQRKKRFRLWQSQNAASRCSTPSGIKGRNARRLGPGSLGAALVLNAFRHQRKKRFKPALAIRPLLKGAQRLPASKEETLAAGRAFRPRARCAQRLPASKEETRERDPTHLAGREVLNAFRHQRKKRSPIRSIEAAAEEGAQRLPASKEETQSACFQCRTDYMCSTPSGIKGRNAGWDKERTEGVGGAQRLPASKEETHVVNHAGLAVYAVLNAFRHQRKKRYLRMY